MRRKRQMQSRPCSRINLPRNRISRRRSSRAIVFGVFFVLLIARVVPTAECRVHSQISLHAWIEQDRLEVTVFGIDGQETRALLEDGQASQLIFRVQVYSPSLVSREIFFERDYHVVLQQDHVHRLFVLSDESGIREFSPAGPWLAEFSTVEIELPAEIPADARIRARVIWEPVRLIAGFRFLRMLMPGLQQRTDWVQAERAGETG